MGAPSITIYRGDTSRLKSQVPIAERYTAAFHEEERKKIFARAWLPMPARSTSPTKATTP